MSAQRAIDRLVADYAANTTFSGAATIVTEPGLALRCTNRIDARNPDSDVTMQTCLVFPGITP